jgi:hypothetical protein
LGNCYGAHVCETLGPAAFKNSKCLHAVFASASPYLQGSKRCAAPHAGGTHDGHRG